MRKIVVQIIFSVLYLSAQAQKVSNIRAEQIGQDIVVFYSLEATSPCEVSLLLSQDNGVTWGSPLKNVSGDIGKNISAGEKQIIWRVLEEREELVGEKIKFKVITNSKNILEPEMVFVQGGTFQMGSLPELEGNSCEMDEKPQHSVTLSSYYIAKYEVTQAQWLNIMGNNPSYFQDCWDCPVENISWNDVQRFILKLNEKTGKKYRLPTEAEWEYAAKGGLKSKGYEYSGSNDINEVAWYYRYSNPKTYPVGSKKSNELGIYDMSGNVFEWCIDWYGAYNAGVQINPYGAAGGESRVLKGGAWYFNYSRCRVAGRWSSPPETVHRNYGFRLGLSFNEK